MHKEIKSLETSYHKTSDSWFKELMVNQHYLAPFAFYLPISSFFLFKSFVVKRTSLLHLVWMLPLVYKFWGYLEFYLHKTALHKDEERPIDLGLIQEFHDLHHQYPNDDFKIGTPLWASIPSGVAFYATCRTVFGVKKGEALFGLLVLYYLFYEFTHIAAHKMNIKHPFFQKIKKHHLRHHFHDSDKGFGFTAAEWDTKNGTDFDLPRKKKKEKTKKKKTEEAT